MKRILVAEDNKLIQQTIAYKLVKDGFEVITVDDGKACLEKLESLEVDLLITDLFMPFINGHEVISTIRNEWKKNLPIMVLSSAGSEETVLKAFELGADDYMVKPFSLGELTVRVKKLLIIRH
ncbi:MAG TPA: response regulator [Prolixibacteraceae bacterium]|jgi:DNA-binding response OmpR family regulator|nr:response regulator [Prolixibacteraceae bacterium]